MSKIFGSKNPLKPLKNQQVVCSHQHALVLCTVHRFPFRLPILNQKPKSNLNFDSESDFRIAKTSLVGM